MEASVEMIFVYGTLRRGGSNHFRMAGAVFAGAATVRARLYRIDWYPGLVLDGAADRVTGEIYQAGADLLRALDDFEGPGYRRVRAQAACADGASRVAWLWEWTGGTDESRRILNGNWLSPPQSTEP
jgi:gamma-glutamylcyclotransferase (GGCT)/AIG2-like uncharacterized protein YtfP